MKKLYFHSELKIVNYNKLRELIDPVLRKEMVDADEYENKVIIQVEALDDKGTEYLIELVTINPNIGLGKSSKNVNIDEVESKNKRIL